MSDVNQQEMVKKFRRAVRSVTVKNRVKFLATWMVIPSVLALNNFFRARKFRAKLAAKKKRKASRVATSKSISR